MTKIIILFILIQLGQYTGLVNLKPGTVHALAVTSPSVSPAATPSITNATSSATQNSPAETDDEKVQEIRQAIKDKLTQIKEKVEKKAYTGTITEITDSTITVINFRGKQRIRVAEGTVILDTGKKEIKLKDLAVEDKIIALGETDPNETLNAKRIIAAPIPKSPPPKKITFFGSVTSTETKSSTLTIKGLKENEIKLKTDSKTVLSIIPRVESGSNNLPTISLKDPKVALKLKDIVPGQKIIVIFPQPTDDKIPIAYTIFVLQ